MNLLGFRPERKRSFISAKGKRNLKRYMKEIQDFWFNKDQNKIEFEENSLLVRNEIKKQLFKQINSQGWLDVLSDDENPSKLIVSKNKKFNHDSFCSIDTNDEDDGSIWEVSKSSESLHSLDEQIEKVKKLKEKETNDKIDELFVKEYGFTAIVEEIIRCEKPIIGHNWFFDMVYFYRQFVGNLPDSFKEFKEKWRKSFKSTFDTKYISSIIPKMVNSSLGQVYKTWCEGAKYKELVSFKFKDGFDRYKKETKWHEAGYDAHMTGHIFATLCKYREVECKVEQERKEMEGIDLNQDDGNDNTEEQKMYRDAMREKQRVPIDLSFLEECRLKIVKNISGGNYFDLASNDIENDDSNNSDDKIQEIIENTVS